MSTIAVNKRRTGTPFDQFAARQPKPRTVPARSLQQRLCALEKANDTRTRRARLKRDLKAGREQITTILLHPPAYVETAKAFDLLLAVPKVGRVKANKWLSRSRISPSKTVGGLSDRQRRELVEIIGVR
jgi:hypothetical protein